MNPNFSARLDALAEEGMAFYRIPGLALAVVHHGQPIHCRGYGQRDAASPEPVTPRTRFALCSLTKSFTAAVVGLLVEEGRCAWDSRVIDLLPGFRLADPQATREVTVRDLLLHRAGLARHDWLWHPADLGQGEMMACLADLAPAHALRESADYSNLGYLIAGAIIEQLSGEPWEQAVQRRLLQPLGMTQTGFDITDQAAGAEQATPHAMDGDTRYRIAPHRMGLPPAGGLVSSIEDLSRWVRCLLDDGCLEGRSIVPAAVLREMMRPQVWAAPSEQPELGERFHGLGLWRQHYRGRREVLHTGSLLGWSSFMALLPDQDLGVAVLCNRNPTPMGPVLAHAAFDALCGLEPIDWLGRVKPLRADWLRTQQAVDRARRLTDARARTSGRALAAFAGRYDHPAYRTMTITVHQGVLHWSWRGLNASLQPCGVDAFRLPGQPDRVFPDYLVLNFHAEPDGCIARLTVALEPKVPDIVFHRTCAGARRESQEGKNAS
jgi:CubicO group peptidase (beta-lactamase class C family)